MPNGQRIYVGNLPPHVRERSVERFFKGFGRIREVVLKSGYGFVEFDDPRDADDAVNDLDGKDFQGGRVRVEMARDPRDKRRDNRYNGGGGYHNNDRYHHRGGGGGGGGGGGYRDHHRDYHRRDRYSRRDDYDDYRGGRGRNDHRGGRDGGNPPGPRTNYRIIVSNLSSRTSWQDLKDYFRAAGDITFTNAHTPRQGEGVVEFASRKGLDYALDHADDLELDGKRLKIVEEKSRGGGGGDRSRSRSRSPRSRSDSRGRSRSRSPRGGDRGGRSRSRSSRSHSRGSPSRSRSNTPNRNGDDDDDDRR